MTKIPEQATINLPRLQRAALASLLKTAPADYTLQDLLDLILAKGLCVLLHGRELPGSQVLEEQAKHRLPLSKTIPLKGTRVAADFVGFSIVPRQQAALEELEARYPLLDVEELGRILLDCAIRALPNDALARERLNASFVSLAAPKGNEP